MKVVNKTAAVATLN